MFKSLEFIVSATVVAHATPFGALQSSHRQHKTLHMHLRVLLFFTCGQKLI